MLSWINEVFLVFGQLFPRLWHVRKTHRAVKFRGGGARVLGPGLHWWWPVTTEVEELAVARQTVNLEAQVVVTADGAPLAVAGVIVYEIDDVEAALVRSLDVEDTIGDVGMTSIVEVLVDKPLAELTRQLSGAALSESITERVGQRLEPFGVRVLSCNLTDFCRCRVVRHLGVPGPPG